MLVERYSQPLVVVATAAPGAGYPKVSINGGTPVATAAGATLVGEGFYGVKLSKQETGKLGTVLVVFAPSVGVVVQVRDLVSEVGQETKVVTGNADRSVQQLNTVVGTVNAARDQIMSVLQTVLNASKARKPSP